MWIERFNKFSQTEFLKTYQEYFKTNKSPELRPIFTVQTKWFTEEGKKELKSMSLHEQYDIILNLVKGELSDSAKKIFHLDDNMIKGFSVWRPVKIEGPQTLDNVLNLNLILDDTGPLYNKNTKWIESEYPKFYDKILRKSMTLAAGEYLVIYYDHRSGKIGFTEEFTTKNKTGNRLKKELEKKFAYFNYEQLESEDRTTFYLIKVPSVDIFIIPSLQEEFKKKVNRHFVII